MKTGIKNQIVIVSAVAAVLLIVMSICAIAESITFEKVAVLAASVLALNTCFIGKVAMTIVSASL